jgi:hypothetical protein
MAAEKYTLFFLMTITVWDRNFTLGGTKHHFTSTISNMVRVENFKVMPRKVIIQIFINKYYEYEIGL